ncbi:NACHT domain-containing [Fusarium albosuccineum]|uniref:NACHT domain-containing n=1 Tax=Fusarium albosuccineum TaxID=1237068 RepID=A0A8H4LCL4_9HYPO|nr:NACHT domain-containing [Fusarium albosuccineum]
MPLARVASPVARQTIKAAYDELDRTIAPGDKAELGKSTLQQVRKAALDTENQLASRQSLCNMRRLMPLFQGLEHYAKVVDVLCNGTPYLPWIWAPITLILRVASEYVEAFDKVIKGYSRIAESLKRFEILSLAFINDHEFQTTLAIFYADILQFHKHAYKFVRRSSWKLMFLTSWGRFERRFDNILEDLERHGSLIDQEANARNIAEARKMREDIRQWREESRDQIRREEAEESAKQHEAIASWLNINKSDQVTIFDSIHSEVSEYEGTCGWILNNAKIRSWSRSQPDTPALWLLGSAGTGKSVLCTQLINFLKASNLPVIHHFCAYSYPSSVTYPEILKSFLLQILQDDGDLVAHVYEEYALGKKTLGTSAMEQLLQKLLTSMSTEPTQVGYLWIIIDGLDECEPDKQMPLVRLINQVTSKPPLPGSTSCKVLISSRAPSNSPQRLRKSQAISLSDDKECLHEAIRRYVGQRLKSLNAKLRQLDIRQVEVEDIQTTIVTKSDGMFLYARLVMDYLSTNIFFSGDEIKASLPTDLDANTGSPGWSVRGSCQLRRFWGYYTRARVYVGYLWNLSRRKTGLDSDLHPYVSKRSQSSNIVIQKPQALQEHGVAAVTCLLSGLLVFGNTYEGDKYLQVAKGLHSFQLYATEYWTEYLLSHVASAGTNNTLPSSGLLGLAFLVRFNWVLTPRSEPKGGRQHSKPAYATDGISMMLDSYQDVLKWLLDQNHYAGLSVEDLELFKVHFGTAAYTCRLGSCPRATLGFQSEALRSAHEMSHIRCFRCNFTGCQYPPTTSAPALKNHIRKHHCPPPPRKAIRKAESERQLDLQQKPENTVHTDVDTNSTHNDIQMSDTEPTPHMAGIFDLRNAAKLGNAAVITRLCEAGVDANDPEAMLLAALQGHSSVVELLLAYGANPDPEPIPSKPPEFATPILAAIGAFGENSLRVVELLVGHAAFDPTRGFQGEPYASLGHDRQARI